MQTRLTLVRHGHTDWNGLGRYQGHAPIPLSERGLAQARCLAEALGQDATIGAVYSSDLLRCRQTAGPIAARLGLEVRCDWRFRELDYGNWQGMTLREVQRLDPDNFAAYRGDPGQVAVPGGESQKMLAARVVAGLRDLLTDQAGRHVVLVSHGGPLREILRLFGLWSGELPAGNASRSVIEVGADGTAARLLAFGDVSHLPADLRPDTAGTTFLVG